MPPSVVAVNSIPAPDSNTSDVTAIWSQRTACLIYGIRSELDEYALVLAHRCSRLVLGGPNDEAFHRHRFFACGLQLFSCQEVTHSPWIAEVWNENAKDGNPDWKQGHRHFVVAAKESTVDVLCESLNLVRTSDSLPDLVREAAGLCGLS